MASSKALQLEPTNFGGGHEIKVRDQIRIETARQEMQEMQKMQKMQEMQEMRVKFE